MLQLNTPYYVINGVSVFSDDSDPLQWYFLPMMPHLSTTQDLATGQDVPVIQLIEYEGHAGTGGFINFDVNLGIDPSALADVTNELKRQAHLDDNPRLSPVTFVDGSVRLLILGSQSPDPAPSSTGSSASSPAPTTTPTGTPQFVIKIQSFAKPALFGDNQASFSVQLDQYGATILEQALKGDMVPIAVIYSLDFLALRPAFHVHLHIDWNRVQTYLDQNFGVNVLVVSADIDKAVEKLREDQAITIEVDDYVAGGDPGSHQVSDDLGQAMAEVYALVKQNFFQSSLGPPDQADDLDKDIGAFKTVSDTLFTGGASNVSLFSYKSTDLTRIDQKNLDVNLSERTAVIRTIYPQGHLSGLLNALQTGGLTPDRFILKVDLDNPWFQRRRVNVVSHADFKADSIASINVNLSYNGIVQSVFLNGSSTPNPLDWSSVLVDGLMQRPITYTYTVNFQGVDTTQRPNQLTSPQYTAVGDVIDIQPRGDLYGITVIPIRAENFPWDRYPSVEVECRHIDAANSINLQASAILTAQAPYVEWPMFLCDATKKQFDYRLTYSLVTGGTSTTPWNTSQDAKVDILDPFPSKISLTIIPALDWTSFSQALVYVCYPSKDNPAAQQSYQFSKTATGAVTFTAERQDPQNSLVYYEVRLLKNNGQVSSVPGSVTDSRYLTLQDGMKGHNIISVAPEQVDFVAKSVSEIDVQVRYVDSKNSLTFANQIVLKTKTDLQTFVYDCLDDTIHPEYRIDIQLDNGRTQSSDWAPIEGNTLTVPLSQLT